MKGQHHCDERRRRVMWITPCKPQGAARGCHAHGASKLAAKSLRDISPLTRHFYMLFTI